MNTADRVREDVREIVRGFEAGVLQEGSRRRAARCLVDKIHERLPVQHRDENIVRAFVWEMTGERSELEALVTLLVLYEP